MEFEISYRSEENHIFVPEWENKEIVTTPDFYYTMEENKDKYYYELEIGVLNTDIYDICCVLRQGQVTVNLD